MNKIVLTGKNTLQGTVAASGSKNAALPLMAATLIQPGRYVLRNVPDLRDTRTMLMLLETLGTKWSRQADNVHLDTSHLSGTEAPYELVKTMRASILVLGPLIARTGRARVSLPGGCAIGARPINFHLRGFEQLGINTSLTGGYVEAAAEKQVNGGVVYFDTPSVTGTENVLMASLRARGTTVIKNAAREPEVGNLIDMLTAMGAQIEGRDTDRLTVHGVDVLQPAEATIIPDRIEVGTFLIAGAAAGGEVTVTGCIPAHLPALVEKLQAAGVTIRQGESSLTVSRPPGPGGMLPPLRSVDIRTMPYPGFPTDLQAQFMALMCIASGVSVVHETIFENRFMHVAELQRMGADIKIDGSSAIVTGSQGEGLCGAPVMATDLRASASLVIAGLAARGRTEISRVYHLERGYENMAGKLQELGADIRVLRE
jgi:UDP-N-acetylglucosamine 1-carboxyvinyltransferase